MHGTDEPTKPKVHGSERRQRTESVRVRLSQDERQQIDAAAEKCGLALGSYVRAKLITGPTPRAVRRAPVDRAALAQVLGLLGRVGGNVNQISRSLNFGDGFQQRELNKALKEITEMRNALMTALGREAV